MGELANVKTKGVVLPFRPSLEDIIQMKIKRIKVIQISAASEKSLNSNAKTLIDLFGMTLRIGSIKGIRKDRHGCIIDINFDPEPKL